MHFVIAGKINCPQFTYALMVAQRLKEHLPDFTYLKIAKRPEEWDRWLLELCKENAWHYAKCPLIWREIGLKQGRKDFIGEINKFLDLCYDYYGIPPDILSAEQFSKGEMNWFTQRTESEYFENLKSEAKKRREYRSRQVCITGASSQMTETLILELLQLDLQKREDGLEIRLFDQARKVCQLLDIAADAKYCPGSCGFGNCRVVHSLKEAFTNVDLVIVLDCFARKIKESVVKWLKRNRNAMCILGKALNKYAPQHCRVIIGSPSTQPICYNATVLASFAKKLHVRNIVAVTQDLGRETLKIFSEKTKTPLKEFYCPPVWGFIGLNKFIDVRRTVQTHLYTVPGKRVNSTLPQGTEEYELRTSEGLINEEGADELLGMVTQHKVHTFTQLGRWPCLAKVTAIIDLLKVWGLKQEDGNGEILCLGVYSDGTFNIPRGIYWSQPVILSNGFWVPFADFPIPRSPYFNVYYLFLFSVASLYRTKVKPRIYIPPKRARKHIEIKKCDFDTVIGDIGMPAIKTDAECVFYLKYLTKTELGIDLDEVIEYIEEEEVVESVVLPTEEVVQQQIYCECWRQELKELQKIVFDRSSTTEVEVDLSDNISGSEWTVINAHASSDAGFQMESPQKLGAGRRAFVEEKVHSNLLPSPPSTVCSCEKLSSGSVCQCLGSVEPPKEPSEEKVSTEHFYKEQNAQIFEEDLKDVIYADTYATERHVSFHERTKEDDETGFHLKFYGKKEAVRDPAAELKRQKRISRYETGGEDEVEKSDEKEESSTETEKTEGSAGGITPVAISADDISRDQNQDEGVESLEEHKSPARRSSAFLRDLDLIVPKEVSLESSDRNFLDAGENDQYIFGDGFKGPTEYLGEGDQFSLTSLDEDLEMAMDIQKFPEVKEDTGEGEEEQEGEKNKLLEEKEERKTKRRKEGIPLCCLCRCLVPEGLPCCPCGSTTVVEVFKKESTEVIIHSEDDIHYTVEYFETILRPESEREMHHDTAESVEKEESEETIKRSPLPPESFLPFYPRPENKFKEAVRPFELTKEYFDSLNKTEIEIPEKCRELMAEAKMKLYEMEPDQMKEEDEEVIKQEIDLESVDKENLPPVCEDMEQIKTDFSDLKLFIPCGLEDWRLTVQKKYRDWFFQGPKIKDETYYDVVIEEVSEDEFEVDKQLESFFEK